MARKPPADLGMLVGGVVVLDHSSWFLAFPIERASASDGVDGKRHIVESRGVDWRPVH